MLLHIGLALALLTNINKAKKKGKVSSKWKNDPKYRKQMKKQAAKISKEDIDEAVKAAKNAFEGWAFTSKQERLKLLETLYANYKKRWADFANAIRPTEFFPGKEFGNGSLDPIDYMVGLSEGNIAPPKNLTIASIQEQKLANSFRFHISQYLLRRANDWKAAGFHEALENWKALNERSKFWGDDQRAAFKNWEETSDPRNSLDGRQGVNERIMLRELLRRIDMMVLNENKLDAFVRLHTPWAPGIIGQPHQYDTIHNLRPESLYGPNAGLSEILVPAGYVNTTYDPVFVLNSDNTRYISKASKKITNIDAPGLPFSLVFRSA